MNVADDYQTLREGVGAVRLERDFVMVTGPDALSFLDGQLSQDVKGAGPGTTSWSWLLHPQGKVVALLRVTRLNDADVLLDTDAGWGNAVVERLERFRLRVKCAFELLDWRCVAIRGPRASDVDTGAALRVPMDWPGLIGFDLAGEGGLAVPDGVRDCSPAAYEVMRIEAGFPRMGAELDERTIPAEAGDELMKRAVSFTKGCYTGQELVARIDSRGGKVAKKLRAIVVEGATVPAPGATIRMNERDAGRITSAAMSPELDAPIALGYVRRDVDPPATATVEWDGTSAAARIEPLPVSSAE
jgi:folate-binding protein YgfZ